MDKGKLQESLVTLYLRLNGYFTTGLIVHSPCYGQNQTQVDVLAVRFPLHAQPERGVASARELDCSSQEIDIIIGEVKSRGESLQFNAGLRESPEALSSVLRWVGAFDESKVVDFSAHFVRSLEPTANAKRGTPALISSNGTRIRALLFAPEYDERRANQPWFIPGPPMFKYVWNCLHPSAPRMTCATQYDFGAWGIDLEQLVRYIKKSDEPATFKELFETFNRTE